MKCLECASRVEWDERRIATFAGFFCGDCKLILKEVKA